MQSKPLRTLTAGQRRWRQCIGSALVRGREIEHVLAIAGVAPLVPCRLGELLGALAIDPGAAVGVAVGHCDEQHGNAVVDTVLTRTGGFFPAVSKNLQLLDLMLFAGAPEEIRTPDPQIRSRVVSPDTVGHSPLKAANKSPFR